MLSKNILTGIQFMASFLNQDQIAFYKQHGYLIIRNYLNNAAIQTLRHEALEIINQFEPEELKVFTTEDQQQHTDQYFLESGDKVRCFFEEEALGNSGTLKVEKHLAINKIGHAMHDLIPDFEQVSYSPELLSITKSLGYRNAAIVQSQYIFKQPKIGGKVNPHIDSTFIYTDPPSCLGVWIALEDATTENGCLMAIPGSHHQAIQERFIRNHSNTGTKFVSLNTPAVEWGIEEMKALPVKKGDMILLHGQLAHASYANRSQQSRHAFVLHIADLDCQWPKDNWLQRPNTFPFRSIENVVNP